MGREKRRRSEIERARGREERVSGCGRCQRARAYAPLGVSEVLPAEMFSVVVRVDFRKPMVTNEVLIKTFLLRHILHFSCML